MATFLRPEVIREAVGRLVASRAQRGFIDFLVLKRALKRAAADTVSFSLRDPHFTGAIVELAASMPTSADPTAEVAGLPLFFKVFGIAQPVSRKILTNGPADTLSGPAWRPVVRLEGQRPRRGGLQPGYEDHLTSLLLKQDGDKPLLSDAAIWFFRAADLDAEPTDATSRGEEFLPKLEKAFASAVGLTSAERSRLFSTGASQLNGKRKSEITDREPADPRDYLPLGSVAPDQESRAFADVARAFYREASATDTGLRLGESMALRFTAALLSKRFVILTGLAGSGKTKVAQALASWMSTTDTTSADVLAPGAVIESDRVRYEVMDSDRLSVQFRTADGGADSTQTALPRALIREWVECIRANGYSRDTSARDIREKNRETSAYSPQLNSFETHLKAAAFALIEASGGSGSKDLAYAIVPVGSDWTTRDPLLGYPDALSAGEYRPPTTGVLQFIVRAAADAENPYFLILDEMNLSHVERYFADFLSAMESGEEIPLYDGDERRSDGVPVPRKLLLPDNLFVIGTVNIDETTYLFSPKVLDRAHVIDFTVSKEDLDAFMQDPKPVNLDALAGGGTAFGRAFVAAASVRDLPLAELGSQNGEPVKDTLARVLGDFFVPLADYGTEFGFRTALEVSRFVYFHAKGECPYLS
jgi:hypothetical protein